MKFYENKEYNFLARLTGIVKVDGLSLSDN
jgi:hypothetical protein